MAKRLGTWMTVLSACALVSAVACSEGSDDPAGDGDGDGDGDGTGGTAGDGDGDGDGDGTGGTSGEATVFINFDANLQGLRIAWEEPDTWSASNGMGGAGTVSELEWTDSDGDPEDGAARLSIPFSFTGTGSATNLQKVHLGISLAAETDMTGLTISAKIKLVSGGSEECPLNGKIFAKSGGTYIWGDGGTVDLVEGTWVSASMEPSSPGYTDDGFDEAAIVEIGLEISPNSSATCTTNDVVLLVDSISY